MSKVKQNIDSKQSSSNFKESEARFKALLEWSPQAILILKNENIVFANEPACLLLDFQNYNTNNKSILDIIHPDDHEKISNYIINEHKNVIEFPTTVFKVLKNNNRIVYIEINASLIIYEGEIALQFLLRDITENLIIEENQKILKEKLQKSNQLIQTINSINSMLVLNLTFEETNYKICQILVESGIFQMAWIGQVNKLTLEVVPVIVYGDHSNYLSTIKISADENLLEGNGPIGICFRDGRTKVMNDAMNDPRLTLWAKQREKTTWQSSIVLPILHKNNTIAVLTVYADEKDFFQTTEIQLLETVVKNLEIVNDRNEAISKLNDSQLFLVNITNKIPGLLAYWDKDLKCQFANENYLEWFGIDSCSMKNKHLKDILGDKLFELNFPYIKEVLNGNAQIFEREISKPNGEIISSLAHYNPHIENKKVKGFFVLITDISQIKSAEFALKESKEKYQMIFDTLSEGVALNEIIMDENGNAINYKVIDANPAFYDLADYDKSIPVIGGLASDLYHMNSEFIRDFWENHKKNTKTKQAEYCSPISKKYFQISTSPLVGNKFVSSFFDITANKLADIALKESKERYKMIVDTLSEGVSLNEFIQDEDGNINDFRILEVNESYYEIADCIKGQKVINGLASNLYGMNKSNINNFWNLYKDQTKPSKIEEYLSPLSKRYYSSSISPFIDNKFVTSFVDITANKIIKDELIKSEERYKALVELMPDSVIVYKNEKIIYVNSASLKLVGANSTDELIGKSLFEYTHPDSIKTLKHRLSTINDPEFQKSQDLKLIRKDGTEVIIESTREKIIFQGEPAVLVIARNITERIKLQNSVDLLREEKAHQEMQEAQIRTQSIIKGQEDERKRISRDLHDGLGQILTATKLQLEMIDLDKIQDERANRDFSKIYQLVMETIEEVRRISDDLSPATLHQFGLLSAIDNIVVKHEKLNTDITINLDSNIERKRFNLDLEINVYRIIQECLNNAIKHSKCSQIDVQINLIYDVLRIVVRDNGIGFDQKEKFYNPKSTHVGKGLKNILERVLIFKGEVDITSSHGTSTEISFQVGLNSLLK